MSSPPSDALAAESELDDAQLGVRLAAVLTLARRMSWADAINHAWERCFRAAALAMCGKGPGGWVERRFPRRSFIGGRVTTK